MDLSSTPLTGETYSLEDLLGGELSMVIPAIQRDYCWGADKVSEFQPHEKVTSFIKGIMYLYINDHPATLGLLYGYANPPGSKHIHIIDGQQRLTTLYLLLGMLYRRTPTDSLRRLLISDYAMIDDREPALIYQVRNEAMYFMSDLVMNFFLNRDGRLSMLEKSPWYCKAYDSDATVQGFIGALRYIDAALEEADLDAEWDFDSFAYFVSHKLLFQFYDLGSRTNAEEMFITINTTGEPLTRPQNLKTMLYAMADDTADFIRRWEEMERWFWMHRPRHKGERATSDTGLDNFIDLWQYMNPDTRSGEYRQDSFDLLYDSFLAYRCLVEIIPEAIVYGSADAKDLFLLVPSLAFIARWDIDADNPTDRQNLTDFRAFLKNILRYTKPTASGSDMLAALDIVECMPEADLTSLATPGLELPKNRLLNREELAKLQFLAAAADRAVAAETLARACAHPMLNGRCERIISWCTSNSGGEPVYDLDNFIAYIDLIYEIWGTDINASPALDDVRRALLTIPSSGFPIVRRGDTLLSLCWYDYDWQRLMQNSPSLVRQFLERVLMRHTPSETAIAEMAERYTDRSNPFFFLIKSKTLLGMCGRRTLARPSAQFIGITDERLDMTRWHVEQIAVKYDLNRWTPMRPYGTRCLYTDHRRLNLAVDLCLCETYGKPYCIKVFNRPDADGSRIEVDVPRLLEAMQAKFTIDDDGRHTAYFRDASAAVSVLHSILKSV